MVKNICGVHVFIRVTVKPLLPKKNRMTVVLSAPSSCTTMKHAQEVLELTKQAKEILFVEPSVLWLNSDTAICGDIHGSWCSLRRFLTFFGSMDTTLLFLGDYIDRGTHSLDCLCLLLKLKITFPRRVFLLRGNHETFNTAFHIDNSLYQECLCMFGTNIGCIVFMNLLELFACLPLAAVVRNIFFCVHAGLPPSEDVQDLDDLFSIPKGDLQLLYHTIAYFMLWSDLKTEIHELQTHEHSTQFGIHEIDEFLNRTALNGIIRGHQHPLGTNGFWWNAPERTITISGMCENLATTAIVSQGHVLLVHY